MYMSNIQRFGQFFAKTGPETVTDRYQSVTNCHQLARELKGIYTTENALGGIDDKEPEENQQPIKHRWP